MKRKQRISAGSRTCCCCCCCCWWWWMGLLALLLLLLLLRTMRWFWTSIGQAWPPYNPEFPPSATMGTHTAGLSRFLPKTRRPRLRCFSPATLWLGVTNAIAIGRPSADTAGANWGEGDARSVATRENAQPQPRSTESSPRLTAVTDVTDKRGWFYYRRCWLSAFLCFAEVKDMISVCWCRGVSIQPHMVGFSCTRWYWGCTS